MAVTHLKRGKPSEERSQDDRKVRETVETILADIETRGDAAVRELSEKFDRYAPPAFRLSPGEIEALMARVSARDMEDIRFAQTQVRNFAQAQRNSMTDIEIETLPGVILGHKNIPVQSVGCYVPGGKFPMVASAHMSVLTAAVAGVPRIAAATPPFKGEPNPAVIAAMHLGGAHEIYVMGGIQAIGAMAIGTETIAPVDMLVGPGNAYVAEAKRQLYGVVGIDMVAGPSEIVVVADGRNDADWIAADLLSQSEHDPTSQSILFTDDAAFADAVEQAVMRRLPLLSTQAVATTSWAANGAIILVRDLDEAMPLVDRLAPEHLELAVDDPDRYFAQVRHAGSVFLGRMTPEAVGDYVAGPNHVLPTGRRARFSSGLSVLDFMKRTSFLGLTPDAIQAIGPAAVALAEAEGLPAHAASVALRL